MSIMKHTFFNEKHTEKETQCLLRQPFARPNNRQVLKEFMKKMILLLIYRGKLQFQEVDFNMKVPNR